MTTMNENLLLVDLESVHKVDLSLPDESYRALIHVGVNQNPLKFQKNRPAFGRDPAVARDYYHPAAL
jgi:hypothetical protein